MNRTDSYREAASTAGAGNYARRILPANAKLLGMMIHNIREGRPNMSTAYWLTSSASASLAYVVSRQLCQRNELDGRFHTFYANSGVEALYVAVRFARYRAFMRQGAQDARILIYDPQREFVDFFDPRRSGPDRALCPHVHFAHDPGVFRAEVMHGEWVGVGIAEAGFADISIEMQAMLVMRRAEDEVTVIVIKNRSAPRDGDVFAVSAFSDIVVFGENLADFQVPYGSLSIRSAIYQIWNTDENAGVHSSTWSGNALALEFALSEILEHVREIDDEDRAIMESASSDYGTRIAIFSQYSHEPLGRGMLGMYDHDLDIVTARGNVFRIGDGREILDVGGSSGCSLRGHNSPDVIDNVLERHDRTSDYMDEVEDILRANTKFSHAIPGISGASAVDNAITMALWARPDKDILVGFRGGFSGKSLISINFSMSSGLTVDLNEDAFAPYYKSMRYIDPFAENAADALRAIAATGRVALVWFEIVQGYHVKAMPQALLDCVAALKNEHGFLVGVDEVLTGMWRASKSILASSERTDAVDIVAMSKGTADLIYPVSWALVTDEVYAAAHANFPEGVQRRKQYYKTNIGAHIATNALKAGLAFQAEARWNEDPFDLAAELREIIEGTDLFESVQVQETLIRFTVNKRVFPFADLSFQAMMIDSAVSRLILKEGGLLIPFLRAFLPSLSSQGERREFAARLRQALGRIPPRAVYEFLLGRLSGVADTQWIEDALNGRLAEAV
jgi:4-aminobutyrate aminotransferase-like enzyme